MPSPNLFNLPHRYTLTTESGEAIRSEYIGAVTAGQEIRLANRNAAAGCDRVMVNIAGIAEAYDVEVACVGTMGASEYNVSMSTWSYRETAWVGPTLGNYWLVFRFRNARPSVVIRSQEFTS